MNKILKKSLIALAIVLGIIVVYIIFIAIFPQSKLFLSEDVYFLMNKCKLVENSNTIKDYFCGDTYNILENSTFVKVSKDVDCQKVNYNRYENHCFKRVDANKSCDDSYSCSSRMCIPDDLNCTDNCKGKCSREYANPGEGNELTVLLNGKIEKKEGFIDQGKKCSDSSQCISDFCVPSDRECENNCFGNCSSHEKGDCNYEINNSEIKMTHCIIY